MVREYSCWTNRHRSLTDDEAKRLLNTVRRLAEVDSHCVVLITHKLREVLGYADDISVMRAGRTVARTLPSDTDAAELARLMVGSAPPSDEVAPGPGGVVRLRP